MDDAVLLRVQSLMTEALEPDKDKLIFPSPTGSYLNWGNHTKRVWRPTLKQLIEEGKLRKYSHSE